LYGDKVSWPDFVARQVDGCLQISLQAKHEYFGFQPAWIIGIEVQQADFAFRQLSDYPVFGQVYFGDVIIYIHIRIKDTTKIRNLVYM
jgi:hypothetical protein